MSVRQFEGWWFYTILLPDADRVVCYYFRDGHAQVSVHDMNHNIFRLNAAGEVVWQVQRDEQGKRDWEVIQRNARQRGEDGYREPFMNILLVQPDGSRKRDPKDGSPLKVDHWTPGCRIYAGSLHGQDYELDIETGVARNISTNNRQW